MSPMLHRSVSVYEYLLHAVAGWGVRVAFGASELRGRLPSNAFASGGSNERAKLVMARDSRAACFMADGYARVSGTVGVCAAAGLDTAQAAAGLSFTRRDGVSLLLWMSDEPIGGSGSLDALARVASHIEHIDHPRAAAPAVAHAAVALGDPRARVAVLSLSSDTANELIPLQSLPPLGKPAFDAKACDCAESVERLLTGERPLLFLGAGAARALHDPRDELTSSTRLRRLMAALEKHAIPVVTSPRAKGIFPETHALSLGCYGMAGNPWSRRYVNRGLDTLIVVGSRLGQWTTGGWDRRLAPSGPLVHVDVDAGVFGLTYPNTVGLEVDAAVFLDHLIERASCLRPQVTAAERRAKLEARVRSGPRWLGDAQRASLVVPLKPQRLMSELQAVLNHHAACKAGVNLFCDSGNGVGWVWHHLVLEPPHRLWSTTEVSASGWASGAAIGGKLARPDRPAIAICEESGLLAGGAEIGLAVERHLGVVWLVMVARETGFTRDSIELCRFARSLGARARAIRLPGQFARELGVALEAAGHGQPQLLVVELDPLERPDFPHLVTRDWMRSGGVPIERRS